jgi:hypothetical protein
LLIVVSIALACGEPENRGDDAAGDTTGADDGDTATGTATTATTAPTSATSAATLTSATTDPDTGDEDSDDGSTGEPGGFEFDPSPPDEYTRVDRMGMPAVATALIGSKDAYNSASPADDVDGDFVPEIVKALDGLHLALDDDLVAAGLTPCTVDVCVDQGGPLVLPDTLKIDLGVAPGFPNGRRPTDPVIDLTLAVILLDLGVHDEGVLADLPLNPPAGDKELPEGFPYFATPH